ncbi:MAG: right-handed parallel beta-helix repeat-containing protein [Phycisphaerales bacterium]
MTRSMTLAGFLIAASGTAYATDYTVPGPSNETLTFYLESPLSPVVDGDTIILTDAGNYQNTYIVSHDDLTIRAAAGQTIVLDGQFVGTVVELLGDNLTLEDLTIRNGLAAIDGGAVRSIGNKLTIRRCVFENNVAPDDGGAIVFSDNELLIEDSQFLNNSTQGSTSQSAGGAIQTVRGDIVLRGCTFAGNEADYAGGALHIADTDARYQIEDCVFDSNTATFGGAIWWVTGAEGDVYDSLFDGNIATQDGGGVYHNASPATYTRCTFVNNKTEGPVADDGGAMYITGETTNEVLATSCLFANNTANSSGGAIIMLSGPDSRFLNCTIYGNTALGAFSGSGGGGVYTSGTGATGRFRNCIVRGNTPDQFTGPASLEYSNVDGGAGSGTIDMDPLFVDAAAGDFRLMDESPSIDAGNAGFFSTEAAPTDLDGNPRVVTASETPAGLSILGLFVDHGAYEVQPATAASCVADANADGVLNLDDIDAFVQSFLNGCP